MPGQIQVWEKDPSLGLLVSVPKPDVAQLPFGFDFPLPELDPDPDTTSRNFRYWNAAEALRRGADFWAPAAAPKTKWESGDRLNVRLLNVGDAWNAEYTGRSLNFYRGQVRREEFIYAAESADLLCHELGHAILHAVQPPLWNVCNIEAAAFHEAFGDLSAILCALQVDTIRTSILTGTGGNVFCDSPLSRIAAQFGSALHEIAPDDAELNCLRNAYNMLCYRLPATLVHEAGDDLPLELTTKPHSFSRIFTGALLEILSGMLSVHPAPTSGILQHASLDLRDIVIAAVKSAPAVPLYYAALAGKMVEAAAIKDAAYTAIFRDVFVRRLILSADFAVEPPPMQTAERQLKIAAEGDEHQVPQALIPISLLHRGFDEPIIVEAPENPSESPVRSGVSEREFLVPLTAEDAARAFVEQLLSDGLIDVTRPEGRNIQPDQDKEDLPPAPVTHRLELINNQLHLKRIRFQCSHCMAAWHSS